MWLICGTPDLVGPIDGTNTSFAPAVPLRADAVVYINGLARLPGPATSNGYTWDGSTLTLEEPPVPGDTVAVWQSQPGTQETVALDGPTPSAGVVSSLSPMLGAAAANGHTPSAGVVSSLSPMLEGVALTLQGAELAHPSSAATLLSP